MKRFIPFFPLVLCVQANGQQSTVRGVVSIHNSETNTGKRQYVSSASVEPKFRKATQTTTDVNGGFILEYVEVPEKATVFFSIKKDGLQVVQPTTLSAVAGQHEVVKISMAHPDSIEKYVFEIFKIGKTEAEKKLEALIKKKNNELATLWKTIQQDTAKINGLKKELQLLEEKKKQIEDQAQDLANRYAPINLDDASPLFKNAFSLFQRGNLDSALLILTKVDLANMVHQILKERENLNRLQKEVVSRDSLQKQRTEDVSEALQFKADLHQTRYEFDSASVCIELLIQLDSLNESHLLKYARFLQWLNQYGRSINYYLKAIRVLNDLATINSQMYESHLASTQNNLGVVYHHNNDPDNAEAAFQHALKIRRRLAKTDPNTHEPEIAAVQNNLGLFYLARNDFTQAETALCEAIEIRLRLAETDPETYEPEIAGVQNNLGNLYSEKKEFANAEAAYLQALKIQMRLAETNPKTYGPVCAKTLNNLGLFYHGRSNFIKAKIALQGALEIQKHLSKTNPKTYEPEVAVVQNNLGLLFHSENDFTQAEAALCEALEIRLRLAKIDRKTYDPTVAITQNNLGNLYSEKKEFTSAEAAYLQALQIQRRLAETDPKTYEPHLAMTQNNLGYLYFKKKNFTQAEFYLNEAFFLNEKLINQYSDVYFPSAIQSAANLINLFIAVNDTSQELPNKAVLPARWDVLNHKLFKLAKLDTSLATLYVSYCGNYSWYALFARKFKEAELAATKAYDVDSTQVWIKTNLAHALLFQNRYIEAIQVYKELKPLKNEESKSYATICLEDLEALEKQGITHKDVSRIREFLRQ